MSKNNQSKLSQDYLYAFFEQSAIEYAQQEGIDLKEVDIKEYTQWYVNDLIIQNLKDGVCSLNRKNFEKSYSCFINIVNYPEVKFSAFPDETSLRSVREYVADVPELVQFCDLVDAYKKYDSLRRNIGSYDFNEEKEFFNFHEIINSLSASSAISSENRRQLFSGLCALYSTLEKSQASQEQQEQQEIPPLEEGYLQQYYKEQIQGELNEINQEVTNEELERMVESRKESELQRIKDGICSFNPDTYNEAYGEFLNITYLSEVLANVEDEEIQAAIENHLQNVPELKELYDFATLYLQTRYLVDQNKSGKLSQDDVDEVYNSLMKYRQNGEDNRLSDANLANFSFAIAKLYEKCDMEDTEIIDDLYDEALRSSDNPQIIRASFKYFKYTSDVNATTQESCNRVLANRKDQLSDLDHYYLYLTLGDSYSRHKHRADIEQSSKREHRAVSNAAASKYYEAAFTYAPTKSMKYKVAKRIHDIDPENYNNKPCSQEIPLKVVRGKQQDISTPYGRTMQPPVRS